MILSKCDSTIKEELPVKCALCGKTVASKKYDHEPRNAITEIIDGETYTFDNTDCVLMFKKFRIVYGPHRIGEL